MNLFPVGEVERFCGLIHRQGISGGSEQLTGNSVPKTTAVL